MHGDNLEVLREMADGCADLIYIDPPFNTGNQADAKADPYGSG